MRCVRNARQTVCASAVSNARYGPPEADYGRITIRLASLRRKKRRTMLAAQPDVVHRHSDRAAAVG
jgi:hypothetical protein